MNLVIPLTDHHVAAFKAGFAEECRRLGKPVAATSGGAVILTDAQWADVHARFAIKAEGGRQNAEPRPVSLQPSAFKLGDAMHRLAGPIGRALGWPCLKGDGSTDLKPGSPCDKLRSALNNLTTKNTNDQ